MTITRKRYQATITNRTTGETVTIPLYDEQTANGTSGEGKAFAEALKLARQTFPACKTAVSVDAVMLTAELDIEKAVKAGAVGKWSVSE